MSSSVTVTATVTASASPLRVGHAPGPLARPIDPGYIAAGIDVAELYSRLARPLERIVRFEVTAPEPVIEDACQVAWSRLIHHAHRVEPAAVLTWLVTTARREALKLVRRDRRELSLEAELDASPDTSPGRLLPGPHEVVEQRERIGALAALPERQRRMLWLHALGLTYAEIAAATGDTPRTVERQLFRARRRVRAVAD